MYFLTNDTLNVAINEFHKLAMAHLVSLSFLINSGSLFISAAAGSMTARARQCRSAAPLLSVLNTRAIHAV